MEDNKDRTQLFIQYVHVVIIIYQFKFVQNHFLLKIVFVNKLIIEILFKLMTLLTYNLLIKKLISSCQNRLTK